MRHLLGSLAAASLLGCSSGEPDVFKSDDPCGVEISRFRELEIVDDLVVNDPRGLNASSGPWSFRRAIEAMVPEGQDPSAFVMKWLTTFGVTTKVNQFDVPARLETRNQLICPWLRLSSENQCNADCSTCAERRLDLAKAPFRLIAIANRLDLLDEELGNPPEGRLLYALTDGPGDDPSSSPREMTVIFEYALKLDGGRTPTWWAEQWHALGAFETFDEEYKEALQAITDAFRAPPFAGQVRTNDRVTDWLWELREYHLVGDSLALAPVDNTPDQSLNATVAMRDFLLANREPILAGKHVLPKRMEGGRAVLGFDWVFDVDEPLRAAFAKETCSGCHQTEVEHIDINFQVSPFRRGTDKLSRFINNPDDPRSDDLGRRERAMARLLCPG